MSDSTPPAVSSEPCLLCQESGGEVVHGNLLYRIVWADEPLYPGFLRLIWNAHVREFSELSHEHRLMCMEAVTELERFVLTRMGADKVNLATLGNVVPHLHWHVIPRFEDDVHFPAPVWAEPLEKVKAVLTAQSGSLRQFLCERQLKILDRKAELVGELAELFKE